MWWFSLYKLRAQERKHTLTKIERDEMRMILQTEMKKNPVRAETIVGITILQFLLMRARPIVFFAVIIVLTTGGGVSYAAEYALPGEPLYVVKTKINERVALSLAFTDRSKARVATRLAERRFEELTKITRKKNVNHAEQQRAEDQTIQFEQQARIRIEHLKRKGKKAEILKLDERLLTSLEETVSTLSDNEASNSVEVAPLLTNVRERVQKAHDRRIRFQHELEIEDNENVLIPVRDAVDLQKL